MILKPLPLLPVVLLCVASLQLLSLFDVSSAALSVAYAQEFHSSDESSPADHNSVVDGNSQNIANGEEEESETEEEGEGEDEDGVAFDPGAVPLEKQKRKIPFKGYGKFARNFKELCDGIRADGRDKVLHDLLQPYLEQDEECLACQPLFKSISFNCKPKKLKETKPKRKKGEEGETPAEEPGEHAEKGNDNKSEPEPSPAAEVTPTVAPIVTPAENATPGSETPAAEGTPPTVPTIRPTPTPEKFLQNKKQREPSSAVIDAASRLFSGIAREEKILPDSVKAIKSLGEIIKDNEDLTPGERDYLDELYSYIEAPFAGYKPPRPSFDNESSLEDGERSGSKSPDLNSLFNE